MLRESLTQSRTIKEYIHLYWLNSSKNTIFIPELQVRIVFPNRLGVFKWNSGRSWLNFIKCLVITIKPTEKHLLTTKHVVTLKAWRVGQYLGSLTVFSQIFWLINNKQVKFASKVWNRTVKERNNIDFFDRISWEPSSYRSAMLIFLLGTYITKVCLSCYLLYLVFAQISCK